MIACLRCNGVEPLCDACVDASADQLRGTARARGIWWAEGVARRMGTRRAVPPTWPAFEGKARAIALAKIANLTRDARLRERLAEACNAEAARTWRKRAR